MLETLGLDSLDNLLQEVIPENIRLSRNLELEPADGESGTLNKIKSIADRNQVFSKLHRPWILRLDYAGCHSAQHSRRSGVVHTVHALPS